MAEPRQQFTFYRSYYDAIQELPKEEQASIVLAVCAYSEKFKNYSNKVKFIWELAGEYIEVDGEQKPRQLSKEFAFSASKKGNLRTFLSSWNSREYGDEEFGEVDVFDQIGKPCQLQVVHNETGEYANVANLMPLPRGVAAPATSTKPIRWDMEQWDDVVFTELPEWIQDQIKKSTQYQKEHTPTDRIEVKPPEVPAAIEAPAATMTGGAPF